MKMVFAAVHKVVRAKAGEEINRSAADGAAQCVEGPAAADKEYAGISQGIYNQRCHKSSLLSQLTAQLRHDQ